jgi:hypothetical protein
MSELQDFIDNAHHDVEFGAVNFTVKKYGGKIATVDANKNITYKTEKGNVEGMAVITSIVKGTSNSIKLSTVPISTPPTLTFTAYFDRAGEIRQINVNDFKRQSFKKEK